MRERGVKKCARRYVVTAGPTREYIDAVRFLSNPSSGRMGFAVAAAAARRGFRVTLVAGPCALPTPEGVERIDVVSARDMASAVGRTLRAEDTFVAVAAVADWRPAKTAKGKLKKDRMEGVLRLVRNPDILKRAKAAVKVGFAAETDDVLANAARKCRAKKLDMIVANDVGEPGCGFGSAANRVTFVFRDGTSRALPKMSKRAIADRIVEACEGFRS